MVSPTKAVLSFLFVFIIGFSSGQSIDEQKLLQTIEYLSSDKLEGRKTLSEGNKEAQEFIREEFRSLNLSTHYAKYFQKFSFENRRERQKYEDATNVVAFIPGKDSRKIIVITAHYDHVGIGRKNSSGDSIYNGADDNASGTAALLAFATYFKKNQPEHPIIFAALDGEEMGLQGAKALLNDFPFPLEDILVNINMDMISRNENGELYASGTYHNPNLKPILENASKGSNPVLKFGHDEPNTGRDDWTQSSDHGPFFDQKIPHIYFGVEDHKDYHKPSDEFKNIDQAFYVNATNLILKCILALDAELPKE
ncbi:M28 family peptidase [Algoriphagus marinus]|uniref:M28 family peptidase n=1 Tax=Algoriphagus marinus TaxID=1925762 RepID=UPI00094B8EBA|nr:M28 family peptidase [Algoriphagus marinus]